MRQVVVAATQMHCGTDREANLDRAEALVRAAAADGANIILLQELFETRYFCQDQREDLFALAAPAKNHPTLKRMGQLAADLGVVLPISFFERANMAHYNAVMVFDADGEALGIYRKSHIPDGPGYQEKYYFNPGDTGFRVWQTKFGCIGLAICWDQWFPEAARVLALQGAEMLFYPTAIGSEPQAPELDSSAHWRRVMQGHAAANLVPVVASNRIGIEATEAREITFYGCSFITDQTGAIVAEAGGDETTLFASFDLDRLHLERASWGLFRDRRPDLYRSLLTLDGGA